MSAGRPSSPDFAEIRAGLIASIETLAAELVPDGKKKGNYWIGSNPTRADKNPGSFWIKIKGRATGAWTDEATGEKGDAILLVKYCLGLKNLSETRTECMKWLGLSPAASTPPPTPAEKAALDAARQADFARREQDEKQALTERAKKAFGLWLKADELKPVSFIGSVLETYLMSRAIDLASGLLARQRPLPGALRFFPKHDYFCADGEILSFPCMAALMSGADGRGRALHRTWLAPDGTGKAVLPSPRDNKARKIWGPPNGAVIRIAKGAGNLSPEEAVRQGRKGPLVITEGVEDALAVHLALPDHRVWAAGTLGNIGNAPVLPCISSIVVCADNDFGKDQAEAALEAAVAKLKTSGVAVKVARSPRGKDMNDLLKGETI